MLFLLTKLRITSRLLTSAAEAFIIHFNKAKVWYAYTDIMLRVMNQPYIYHYTDKEGAAGILITQESNPFIPEGLASSPMNYMEMVLLRTED